MFYLASYSVQKQLFSRNEMLAPDLAVPANVHLQSQNIPNKKEVPVRAELFDFQGVPMINCLTSNWEKVQSFQARTNDILIATYPKAGWSKLIHKFCGYA